MRAELVTDTLGHFVTALAPGRYRILLRKDVFFDRQDTVQLGQEKMYRKLEMRRKPGYTFDWRPSDQPDEIKVTVVPDRAVLSKRLQGAGAKFSPGRSAVNDLIRERQRDPS